jgi:uncharacterized lipoprotein YehR (DUF1307 family)
MTELQLYKYINDNNIEYHYEDNNGEEDVLIFPRYYEMEELTKMIGSSLEDGKMKAILRDTYLCVWMKDICEVHGIEMSNVFKKEIDNL